MDVALLIVEYQDRHAIEQAVKQVVYSVKLKLEFAILSKLVHITQSGRRDSHGFFEDSEQSFGRVGKEGTLELASFQSDDAKTGEKDNDAWHIERADSAVSRRSPNGGKKPDVVQPATFDEQRRRSTLDNDLYRSALRDIS